MVRYTQKLLLVLAISLSLSSASGTTLMAAPQNQHQESSSSASEQQTRKLLQTTTPTFTVANIGQTTPLASACNNIFVTLQLNVDVGAASTFTITGLTGSATPDTDRMMLNSTSTCDIGRCHPFDLEGSWTQAGGRLVLTVQDDMVADQTEVFFFELINPSVEQGSSPVSISASLSGGASIAARRMRTRGASLMAVPRGTDPLRTMKTEIVDVSMSQTNPLALASNELDISIKLNTFLPEMSKLEIFDVDCIEPLEIDDSIYWEICPVITTSSSTTSAPATTTSSSTTPPTTSSTTTTTTAAPTTSSSTTTTTAAPTTSSTTTTAAPTSSSSTTVTSSSTTTTPAPSTTSSTTTSPAPTSSSSTTVTSSTTTSPAPTSSSSTTVTSSSTTTTPAPTTTSSSTTSLAPTTSSSTTAAPTSSSSTTVTSSSSTTTEAPTTSSTIVTSSSSTTTAAPTTSSTTTTPAPTSSSSTTTVAPMSSSTTTTLAPTTSSSTTPAPTSSSTTTTLAPTSSSSTTTVAPTSSSSTTATSSSTTVTSSSSTTTPAPTSSSSSTTVTSSSSTTTPAPTSSSSSTTVTSSSSTTTPAPTSSSSSTTVTSSSSTTTPAPTSSSTTTTVAPTSSSSTTVTSSSSTTTPAPTTTSSSTTSTPAPTTSSSTTTTVAPTTSSSTTTTTPAPTTSSSTTTTAAPTTTPVFTSPPPPFVCCPVGYEPIVVHTYPPYALLHGGFYSSEHRRLLLFNAYDLDTTWWLGPLRANIKVRNRECNQQAPAMSIRGLIDSRDDGEHGGVCTVPIDSVDVSHPNSNLFGISNGANPTRVVPAATTTFTVTQQNPYYDDGTPSVTFDITTNSDVTPGSVILVTGIDHLTRSDTDATTGRADAVLSQAASNFNPVAVWAEADKSIRFVVRSTFSQGQRQTVTVPGFVRDPVIQRTYSSTAVLSGQVESGTYDAPFQGRNVSVTVDLRQASPVRNVRAAQSAAGPIVVSWDRPLSSGPNNLDSELTGFDLTVLTSITPLARNSGSSWALSGEVVNGEDGVSDNAFQMLQGRPITLSVEAKNAFGNSGAASASYVVGSIPCLTSCGDGRQDVGEQCDDANSESGDGCSNCEVDSGYLCFSDAVDWPCPTSIAGLSTCVIPQFEYIIVAEATEIPSISNEITVGFQANAPMQAGTQLLLSGLTGSTQPSSANFQIEPLSGSALSQNAVWTQSTGELELRTTAMIPAGEALSMRFSLSNPSSTQAARSVTITCRNCSYTGGATLADAVSEQQVLGVTVIVPTCTAPFFGPGCVASCSGVVQGDKCVCPPGRFGYTCSQTGVLSVQDSVPPTVVPPGIAMNLLSPSGAGVRIPAGALRRGAVISASSYNVRVDVAEDEKESTSPVSMVMDCRPDLVFDEDVELAIPVDLTTAAVEQSRGRRVVLSFFNTTRARWQVQGGYVDRVTGHSKVNTNHFSTWTAMSVLPSAIPDPGSGGTGVTVPPVVPGGPGDTTPQPRLVEPDEDDDGIWGTNLDDGAFVAATMGFVVLLCCVCSVCCLAIYCCRRQARTPPQAAPKPPAPHLINPEATRVGEANAVFVDMPPGSQQWISLAELPPGAQPLQAYSIAPPRRVIRPPLAGRRDADDFEGWSVVGGSSPSRVPASSQPRQSVQGSPPASSAGNRSPAPKLISPESVSEFRM